MEDFPKGRNNHGEFYYKVCRACNPRTPVALQKKRTCVVCKEEKFLIEFAAGKPGKRAHYTKACQSCIKADKQVTERQCKVCEETKPLSEFKEARDSKGYTYRLKTCNECQKAKDRARSRKYMAKNGDAARRRARLDRQIRYENDEEFREKQKERSRNYYQQNKNVIALKKRERRRKRRKAS